MLQETSYADTQLYAKIGCMERETFTSTKLALHLYTDSQCSQSYDDGESSRRHSTKGYEINGYTFSTRVSFRPPFYTCQTCKPEMVSDTFNKAAGIWYDDDYISEHGQRQGNNNDDENGDNGEDGEDGDDDYYQDDLTDDTYMAANDDVNNQYADDYYNRDRRLGTTGTSKALALRVENKPRELTPADGQLEVRLTDYQ
jgi:hypothetical protein